MWEWQPTGGWAWDFPPYRAKLSDKPRKAGNDGDTLLMVLDQGLGSHQEEAIRLEGVFAPESRQPGGSETAAFVRIVLDEIIERATAHRQRWPFVVKTDKVGGTETHERRSLVRYIGTVYAIDTGECVNDTIIAFIASHPEWGGGTGGKPPAEDG